MATAKLRCTDCGAATNMTVGRGKKRGSEPLCMGCWEKRQPDPIVIPAARDREVLDASGYDLFDLGGLSHYVDHDIRVYIEGYNKDILAEVTLKAPGNRAAVIVEVLE